TNTSSSYLNHVYGTDPVGNSNPRWSSRARATARKQTPRNLVGRLLLLLLRTGRTGATQSSALCNDRDEGLPGRHRIPPRQGSSVAFEHTCLPSCFRCAHRT